MHGVSLMAVGYARSQILAYLNPARLLSLADPAPAASGRADHRADPGRLRPDFTRGWPARPERPDPAKITRKRSRRQVLLPVNHTEESGRRTLVQGPRRLFYRIGAAPAPILRDRSRHVSSKASLAVGTGTLVVLVSLRI
jgi:hypothetical protein